MTPVNASESTNITTREARGIDLQAAYLVLIRAWLRRYSTPGNSKQNAPGVSISLP